MKWLLVKHKPCTMWCYHNPGTLGERCCLLKWKKKKRKFSIFMWAEGFSTEQREGRKVSSVKHNLESLFRKVCKCSSCFIQSKRKPFVFYRSSSAAWELRDCVNTWISLWDTVLHWEESRAFPEGSWTLREQRWQAAHPKPKVSILISYAAETFGDIFQRPECDTKVGEMASELHRICTNTPGNNGKTPLGSPGPNRRHCSEIPAAGKGCSSQKPGDGEWENIPNK